jgi:hypothetical protein
MNSPPAARPTSTPTRTLGRRIEVRSYEGDLIRTVVPEKGAELFTAGLADQVGDHLRLKPGIRWIPPRSLRSSGRPDLQELKDREPERYADKWRGSLDPHVGRGALGRRTTDRIIVFALEARP